MKTAETGHEKEMFEKNLRLLSAWLRETVLKISDSELWDKVKVEYNADGYPVCRYRQDGKEFHITSMNPVSEVERQSKNAAEQAVGVIFLFGSGFGYPIFRICENKDPQTLVIVFEQNLYLFKAMLYFFDFEPVIKTGKVYFMAGDSEYFAEAYHQLLSTTLFFYCTYPVIYCSLAARRNFKAEYDKIIEYAFSQLSLLCFYMGNDHLDSLTGFWNMVNNTGEMLKEPYISCLKEKCRDMPAFIIANGPSLDKNIEQLKNIKGKGLVISVESAIIPLMKNGIVPDILTVVERTKETYTYHFKDRNYPDSIALLCLCVVDRQVFPSFHGPKIPILRQSEGINNWFNLYIGDGTGINAGTNVSHLATGIALYLGANPVVFVGQDYAYGTEGTAHSKSSVYYEKEGKQAESRFRSMPVVYAQGNNGAMVESNQLWSDFRLGLENMIASQPGRLFLNATEGGAKIKGTECEPLDKVIEKYCTKPLPCRIDELINENKAKIVISERKKRLAEFIENVKTQEDLFFRLTQETNKGKLRCMKAIRLARQSGVEENMNALDEANIENLKAHNLFVAGDLCLHFIEQIFFIYNYLACRIKDAEIPDKIIEVLKLQYNCFCLMDIICQSLLVNLEDAEKAFKAIPIDDDTNLSLKHF